MSSRDDIVTAFYFGSDGEPDMASLPEGGMSIIDFDSNPQGDDLIEQRVPDEDIDIDLFELFRHLNSRDPKVSWEDRYKVIASQIPAVEDLDFEELFRSDPEILGVIINDMMRRALAPQGRPGKRPSIEKEQAAELLKRYRGEDYSLKPFKETFNDLKAHYSVRHLARKISMSTTYTHGLLSGDKEPTISDMELIARGLDKHPSVFYEYRVAFVIAAIAERMDFAPESSITYYERLKQALDGGS